MSPPNQDLGAHEKCIYTDGENIELFYAQMSASRHREVERVNSPRVENLGSAESRLKAGTAGKAEAWWKDAPAQAIARGARRKKPRRGQWWAIARGARRKEAQMQAGLGGSVISSRDGPVDISKGVRSSPLPLCCHKPPAWI